MYSLFSYVDIYIIVLCVRVQPSLYPSIHLLHFLRPPVYLHVCVLSVCPADIALE